MASRGPITQALIDASPALVLAGAAIGVYHGFKRDNSVAWALGWGVMGATLPVLTIPLALAQGIGQPK